MKKLIIIASVAFLFNLSLNGQTDSTETLKRTKKNEQQTLFNINKGVGGYIGFNTRISNINSSEALFTGGEISIAIGHSLNLGFEGYGLVNPVESNNKNSDESTTFINMGYGGLHIEPVLFSQKLVHVTFPILLGAGGIGETRNSFLDEEFHEDDNGDDLLDTDFFMVVEPGIMAEVNLFRFMRLGVGINYRITSGVELPNHDNEDFSGLSGNISLRLGWF